jgi:hypothetical protein
MVVEVAFTVVVVPVMVVVVAVTVVVLVTVIEVVLVIVVPLHSAEGVYVSKLIFSVNSSCENCDVFQSGICRQSNVGGVRARSRPDMQDGLVDGMFAETRPNTTVPGAFRF